MAKKKLAPSQDEKSAEVTRSRKYLMDPNAPTYYANTVDIGVSNSDFRIRLGEILEANDSEMVVKHRATVYFSPRHAKEVCILFNRKVKEFEDKCGIIDVTD